MSRSLIVALALALTAACGPAASTASVLPADAGFSVSVWTLANSSTGPDSLEFDGTNVWVGWQNKTSKTGGDGNGSSIIKYSRDGKTVLQASAVPGHCDGVRWDPVRKIIWASSNEDGNPNLATVDQNTGKVTNYNLPSPTPHGGGYDDMGFVNGKMFIAASNPSLDPVTGINTAPALAEVTINGTDATLTPVLMGNDTATDISTGLPVSLNLTDPDSITITPEGKLALISQGDNLIVFIDHPGEAGQTVTVTPPLFTQLDDTIWVTSPHGQMLVADGSGNTVYSVHSDNWVVGTIFSETPDDSTVPHLFGIMDLMSGNMTVISQFSKPTGMLFLPDP